MSKQKFSAKGAEALFAAALTYAFTGVLIREVGSMWGDKAQVAARWTLVLILLLGYGYLRKSKARIPRAKLNYAMALGITFAITVLFFTFSIQRTTFANSLFTFYAATMVVSFLLGTIILRENVTIAKAVSLAFALVGLGLYTDELLLGTLGIIFGVIAGASEGISNVLRKRLTGVDRTAVLRMQYAVGTVFIVLLTLISKDEIIREASVRGSILTIMFAFILILASYLMLYGYQHFDVNVGTVIMSTELVFGVLLGLILYNEVPSAEEWIGGTLILVGSVIGSLEFKKFKLNMFPMK